jgi:hypothetical protein
MVVRRHLNLHETFNNQLLSGTSAAQADQILFHTPQGWQTHWRLESGSLNRWVRAGDSTLQDTSSTIIPPGSGLMVKVKGPAVSWYQIGHVRTSPFRRPLLPGNNLIAAPWPLDGSPNGWLLTPANGFSATSSPATSDQLQLWNGTGYDSYWLLRLGMNARWTPQASSSLEDVGSTLPLPANSAFFFKAQPGTTSWNIAPPQPAPRL